VAAVHLLSIGVVWRQGSRLRLRIRFRFRRWRMFRRWRVDFGT